MAVKYPSKVRSTDSKIVYCMAKKARTTDPAEVKELKAELRELRAKSKAHAAGLEE
jgi:hypothetical protein